MLRKSKWLFYFRHLMLMSTLNKVRLTLTAIGIFVAVFLFSAGLIITNSYYEGNLRVINEMKDNTLVVKTYQNPSVAKSTLSELTSAIPMSDYFLIETKTIFSEQLSENQYLNVTVNIHGISEFSTFLPNVTDDGVVFPYNTSIVKGRGITADDVSEGAGVVVIDELTEMILFPNGDSVGSYITLGTGMGGVTAASSNAEEAVSLKVIGVVENSYISETKKLTLKQQLNSTDKSITLNTSLYVPVTFASSIYDDEELDRYYIYAFDDSSEYSRMLSAAEAFFELKLEKGEAYEFTTKELLLEELENEFSGTKTVVNLISLILCIISGISIMSIIFFSVKERISEIGIRKAFGASRLDIVFQFMFETVIISMLVSAFAVCMSCFACKIAEAYLVEKLYMSFSISVTWQQLLLPVLVGMTEAILCSVVPSLYASKIKVTDALRFE